MVGSSVLMALPIALGGGLQAAVGMAVLFGLLIGVGAIALVQALGGSRPVTIVLLVFVLFEPNLFNFSTSPDALIFYAAFVVVTLACLARGPRHPGAYIWAGLFAAFAHAMRQDGLFLMPVVALAILVTPREDLAPRTRGRTLLAASLVYLVSLAPLLVTNLVQQGVPLPFSLSRTVFAQSYEDIYTYAQGLDWDSYRARGWGPIWLSKCRALEGNGRQLRELLGLTLWVIVALGTLRALVLERSKRPVAVAGLALLGMQFVFYSMIGDAVASQGAFRKAALAIMPLFVGLGLDGIWHAGGRFSRAGPWIGLAATLALIAPRISNSMERAGRKVRYCNDIGAQVRALRDELEATLRPGDPRPVLMSRHPWELHTSTGYGAVQVPNDGLETIIEVAQRYGVTHIVLPVPRSALTLQRASADPRLEEVVRLAGSPIRVFAVR